MKEPLQPQELAPALAQPFPMIPDSTDGPLSLSLSPSEEERVPAKAEVAATALPRARNSRRERLSGWSSERVDWWLSDGCLITPD